MTNNKLREEFEEKFVRDDGLMDKYSDEGDFMADAILMFIETKIEEAVKAERERIMEVLCGMEKEEGCCWDYSCQKFLFGKDIGKPEHDECMSTAQPDGEVMYNQALKEAKEKI